MYLKRHQECIKEHIVFPTVGFYPGKFSHKEDLAFFTSNKKTRVAPPPLPTKKGRKNNPYLQRHDLHKDGEVSEVVAQTHRIRHVSLWAHTAFIGPHSLIRTVKNIHTVNNLKIEE